MSTLREQVDNYVREMLKDYVPLKVRGSKVIHDTILGSNIFSAHEIAILDLPLVQRLRRINQVDVVPLVFPSGNHNRFEHSLGVASIGEKLVRALFKKITEGQQRHKHPYVDITFREHEVLNLVRMAAIMHDCGHGPFSHMSERIYKELSDIQYEKENDPRLVGASPHEILSYLIVTSTPLHEFFEKYIAAEYKVNIDLQLVGDMIVGYVENPASAFVVDIINGAFDADKLDYIQRDSYFTGIKMVLDLDRLFYALDIVTDQSGRLRLSVDLTGVTPLEQIVFNKMMLYSSVYHHHKVRAAECLFKSIFDEIMDNNLEVYELKFDSAADFLYLTDDDVYGLAKGKTDLVVKFTNSLLHRNLPKRALVVSGRTVDNHEKLEWFMRLAEKPEEVNMLRQAISDKTSEFGEKVPVQYIWVDVPSGPKYKEGYWPIKNVGGDDTHLPLRKIFPVDDWTKAFSENKWNGYVFTLPKYRSVVYNAAKSILEDVYELKLNNFSKLLCKMDADISEE
ncbi:HD domain-containing protein [Paradesulfitobacterium ferrireducens]|uniref:HD domain-containing protein n=1 Tax=Paradesulfitobacterium ferrireducens TaxID=2816476 RepID=UPI001A8E09A9|nr:HD domain-containing protein [Paradesulfitobacterium ferrireducens]